MPMFQIYALERNGKLIKHMGDFPSEYHVYLWLKERELQPVKIKKSYLKIIFKPKIGEKELISFSRHMHYILRSGISVVEGIEEIKSTVKNQTFSQVLESIKNDVESGLSLSQALSRHPYIFPSFYVAVVRSGEETGNLDVIFNELSEYLSWLEDNKNKVKQAFIYPTIVSIIMAIALTIFIVYVIPKLSSFLMELNMALPLPTRMLIAFNTFVLQYWYIFIFMFFSVILLIFFSRFSEKAIYLWDKVKLKIPYIGNVFFYLVMVRFVKYMGLLYKSGVQIYQSLDVVKEIVGNEFYIENLTRVKGYVEEGESLGEAIDRAGYFPTFLIRSIRVGESTGNLEDSFRDLSIYYNQELDRAVRKITSIIEPALLVFVAVIILIIIISVLYPIYSMLGQVR